MNPTEREAVQGLISVAEAVAWSANIGTMDEHIEKVRALLDSADDGVVEEGRGAGPNGMQLVPIEPTAEQEQAIYSAFYGFTNGPFPPRDGESQTRRTYRAMLETSPTVKNKLK